MTLDPITADGARLIQSYGTADGGDVLAARTCYRTVRLDPVQSPRSHEIDAPVGRNSRKKTFDETTYQTACMTTKLICVY